MEAGGVEPLIEVVWAGDGAAKATAAECLANLAHDSPATQLAVAQAIAIFYRLYS